jgi:hypothetical protein
MRSRLIINGSELGLGWGTKVNDLRIGLDMLGSCLLDAGIRRSRPTAVKKKVEPKKAEKSSNGICEQRATTAHKTARGKSEQPAI